MEQWHSENDLEGLTAIVADFVTQFGTRLDTLEPSVEQHGRDIEGMRDRLQRLEDEA